MTTDEKLSLITRNLEEVLTTDELRKLLESGTPLKHYIGFEISGKIHVGQGILSMMVIKNLQEAGVDITVYLADWHTWLNKKLDGNLSTASKMALQYFAEAMKAGALVVGADPEKIKFLLGSEFYKAKGLDYWSTVIRVSKETTLARMLRSTTIMGKKEEDITDSAMLIYPAMQSADIFTMGVNLAHSGTDQRNVHVIARENAVKLGFDKPIALHQHLLLSLSKPDVWPIPEGDREELAQSMKMSKSKPDSAIFIHDNPDEIRRKIKEAFAPEAEAKYNPILDWTKYLVFGLQSEFTIKRAEQYGGNVTYSSYEQLEKDYQQKKLYPLDLKNALAEWLIKKLEPARTYFEDPQRQQALAEIEKLTLTKRYNIKNG
ncbi:MAG: tyrosine--tRNA ligase [Patescibacteria group bacterium]|nr:tyrosine--tRNA ligase [Patescibacteria group bacterium]